MNNLLFLAVDVMTTEQKNQIIKFCKNFKGKLRVFEIEYTKNEKKEK